MFDERALYLVGTIMCAHFRGGNLKRDAERYLLVLDPDTYVPSMNMRQGDVLTKTQSGAL